MTSTNKFEYLEERHESNDECEDCWIYYPRKCRCGGTIHAEFGDEDANGDYWLVLECDKCHHSYDEI